MKSRHNVAWLLLILLNTGIYSQEVKVTHTYKKYDVFKLSIYQMKGGQLSLYSDQSRVGRLTQVMDDAYVIKMSDNNVIYSISALTTNEEADPNWGLSTTGLFRDNGLDKDLRCLVGADSYYDFDNMNGKACIKLHVALPELGHYWVFHILDEDF